MNKPNGWPAWVAPISLLISLGGVTFSAGVVYAKAVQNTHDIAEIKKNRADTIDRLARIETKMDLLLQDAGMRRQ